MKALDCIITPSVEVYQEKYTELSASNKAVWFTIQ